MRLLLAVVLAWLAAGTATARDWRLDGAASELGFQVQANGASISGDFAEFSASVRFDPEQPEAGRIEATVALASVETGNAMRDKTLAGAAFFAVAEYPEAHFSSESVEAGSDGRFLAHGELRMHGVTRPLTLVLAFDRAEDGAVLDVSTSIDRLAFGIGVGEDWEVIARNVQVHARLQLL